MAMAALGLLVAPVSQAQVSLDQLSKQPVDSRTSEKDKPPKDKPPKGVSVPEPDATVLLLISLGVTGLVAYGVNRRKRIA
jgi:hypothetical protein